MQCSRPVKSESMFNLCSHQCNHSSVYNCSCSSVYRCKSKIGFDVFGPGHSSLDDYIRALAVCNNLAELASSGSKAEFYDRIGTLMCLKKHWTRGHSSVKVVCNSNEAEEDYVDKMQLAVEIENVSLQGILSDPRHLTKSQRVLVLCSKRVTDNGTTTQNVCRQTEHYNVFPSLLTVPSACAGRFTSVKCLVVSLLST